ncbi:ketoreductase domain-containing protein, partial [Streptomyces marinisediminis]
ARVARWAAVHGAGHLVLTSRRGPDAPGAADLVASIEELGASATVIACDAADHTALHALKERLEADGTPVTTVIHAAGVASGGSTDELDADTLAAQMDAKVSGAAHLD